MFFPFLYVVLVYGLVAHAQSSAPPFPAFAPLAVKTPYLNTWTQKSDSFGSLPGPIPLFYTKDRKLPWAGLVRVDGQMFQWLDGGHTAAKTVANEFTPTRTIYTIQAGPVQFNVTFFTPIEPDDYVLQSIPFSYLKDGAGFAHAVDLGTISPGSQPDPVVWAIGLVRDPLVAYPTASEVRRGFYWSQYPDITAVVRRGFYWSQYSDITAVVSAFLNNFNSIRDRGLALDNRIVSAASQISAEYADLVSLLTRQIFASMDITLGQEQNGSLNSSDIKIFMKDVQISIRTNPMEVLYGALPALLYFNSSIASHLLEPLLERQTSSPFAGPDLGTSYPTILGNSNGDVNAVDNTASMLIMLYAHAVKSGDGNLLSRYVSVAPSFQLLQLISYIVSKYTTLVRWADYLVSNTLAPPPGSKSVDNLSATGLSNLAIKGILGIYSMAKINEALGIPNSTYMESANRYVTNWTQSAVANNDHIATTFQEPSTSGLIYNLFPAVWLDSGLVDNSVRLKTTTFIVLGSNLYFIDIEASSKLLRKASNQGTGQVAQYGFKFDSSLVQNSVHSDWTFLTAAAVPDDLTSVRDGLIHPLYQRAFFPVGQTSPLPVVYDASSGEPTTGANAR
ncbi:hypothetical protein AN958_05297 [Leucoagaricus sp. SymC.cos]|nr:hypothetical protein AN958_05297 [Leucoagaricus sp. SymC.cos]